MHWRQTWLSDCPSQRCLLDNSTTLDSVDASQDEMVRRPSRLVIVSGNAPVFRRVEAYVPGVLNSGRFQVFSGEEEEYRPEEWSLFDMTIDDSDDGEGGAVRRNLQRTCKEQPEQCQMRVAQRHEVSELTIQALKVCKETMRMKTRVREVVDLVLVPPARGFSEGLPVSGLCLFG